MFPETASIGPDPGVPESPPPFNRQRVLGTICMAACVLMYVGQTVVLQWMQSISDYKKPYFVLWLSHSTFTLMIPLSIAWLASQANLQRRCKRKSLSESDRWRDEESSASSSSEHRPRIRQPRSSISGRRWFLWLVGFWPWSRSACKSHPASSHCTRLRLHRALAAAYHPSQLPGPRLPSRLSSSASTIPCHPVAVNTVVVPETVQSRVFDPSSADSLSGSGSDPSVVLTGLPDQSAVTTGHPLPSGSSRSDDGWSSTVPIGSVAVIDEEYACQSLSSYSADPVFPAKAGKVDCITSLSYTSALSEYLTRVALLSGRSFASFLLIAFLLSVLYTIPNYMWYLALPMTSIGEATSIFNTNCFFAYAFSIWLLREPLRWTNALAIAVSIVGVVLIAFEDRILFHDSPVAEEERQSVQGDLIVLSAAILYGLYEVLYTRYAVARSDSGSTSTFLANQYTGFIGVFTFLILWIPIPILHVLGFEVAQLPSDTATWAVVTCNAFMSCAYNSLFMLAIALTSPLFASVGIMITIPLSILGEYLLWNKVQMHWVGGLGSVAIFIGFGMLVRDQLRQHSSHSSSSSPSQSAYHHLSQVPEPKSLDD